MICYILCPIAILVLFQNCGKQTQSAAINNSLDEGDLIIRDDDKTDKADTPYLRRVQVNQMVANRILTANYFIDIFGPSIENTVASLIAYQAADFGSGNSIYDKVITTAADCNKTKSIYTPCNNAEPLRLTTPATIGANIRREAFRVRSCHTAVKYRTMNALQKIDPKATPSKIPAIDDKNLEKAFHLFFRARKAPSDEILDALTIVSQKKTTPLEQWKDVILSLCLSPHWQVL